MSMEFAATKVFFCKEQIPPGCTYVYAADTIYELRQRVMKNQGLVKLGTCQTAESAEESDVHLIETKHGWFTFAYPAPMERFSLDKVLFHPSQAYAYNGKDVYAADGITSLQRLVCTRAKPTGRLVDVVGETWPFVCKLYDGPTKQQCFRFIYPVDDNNEAIDNNEGGL